MRYRLGLSQFILRKNDLEENLLVAGTDFAIGWEKRKKLTPKLIYFRGFEPALHISTTKEGFDSQQSIGIDLGYVFGFQYNISPHWYINIEIVPKYSRFIFMDNWQVPSGIHFWNFGFDTSQIALSVVYNFSQKTP